MPLTHSTLIAAPPQAVFAVYAHTQGWPVWDAELRAVDLPQGLVPGATGWLTPAKGPRARITVTEVTPGRSFAVQSRLPLCRMTFDHHLTAQGSGTLAQHSVQFTGPLAFVFRRLIGPTIARGLPASLAGLQAAVDG